MILRNTAALAAIVTAIALGGCSTSTSHPDVSDESASPSAMSSESGSPSAMSSESAGGSASESPNEMLPPVEIDGAGTEKVKVGDTLNVITKDVDSVSTDNGSVLQVSQPNSDGDAEFNAGADVVSAGEATLTVKTSDGESYEVKVVASE